MQKLKIGWTLTAVTACVLPLSAILTGCKGTYHSGGPSTATPTTRRTPGVTPGVTPGTTPGTGTTPGATPGTTPVTGVTPITGTTPITGATPVTGTTPVATLLLATFTGNYSGTFNLSSVEAGSSALTMTINANGGTQATVTLNQGGTLTLNGNISAGDAAGATINLTGQTTSIISHNSVAITLTGRLSVAGGSISGSGTVSDSESRNGTWSTRRTG